MLCTLRDEGFRAWLAAIPTRAGEFIACDGERTHLETLYEAMGGQNWRHTRNWLTDAPLEDWYGIVVDATTAKVTEINLHGNNLSGESPPEIGKFSPPQDPAPVLQRTPRRDPAGDRQTRDAGRALDYGAPGFLDTRLARQEAGRSSTAGGQVTESVSRTGGGRSRVGRRLRGCGPASHGSDHSAKPGASGGGPDPRSDRVRR